MSSVSRPSDTEPIQRFLLDVANSPPFAILSEISPRALRRDSAVSRRQGHNVLAIRPGPWRAAERRRLEARQATRCGVVKSASRHIETDI